MDQIFDIEWVKKRALEVLKRHEGFMAAGTIAAEIGVPTYAVCAAMDAAGKAGEVDFEGHKGWRMRSPQDQRPRATEGEQLWAK